MATVAIVGAGITGLATAHALVRGSTELAIQMYEKSCGVGGRVATRYIPTEAPYSGAYILDHGAQNIKLDEGPFADLILRELPTEDLLPIREPIRLWREGGEILPPDPKHEAIPKFAYRYGLNALAKLLQQQLPPNRVTLYLDCPIALMKEEGGQVILLGVGGKEVGRADYVVLTAPLPQSATLLAESALHLSSTQQTLDRVRTLREVEYVSCLSVMLAYAPGLPPPPAYALLAEDRTQTLLWLAFEHVKAPERAPQGVSLLIAQWGPVMSRICFNEEEALVIGRTLNELRRLFGPLYQNPIWAGIKRWRYSQPRSWVPFDAINPPAVDSRIYVAGDGTRPEGGRIHQAYYSGLEVAHTLLKRLEERVNAQA